VTNGVAGSTNTGGGGGGQAAGQAGAGGPGVIWIKYTYDTANTAPAVGAIKYNSDNSRFEITKTNRNSSNLGAKSVQSFTATGPATFTVPTGVTEVEVLVVGGGGSGGAIGGGGGAGGVVYSAHYPVTPGASIPITVGTGGTPRGTYPNPGGTGPGTNSTFGSLTALGGGGSGSWGYFTGDAGGSGSGGCGTPAPPTTLGYGGQGTQPAQANPGATINLGYPGAMGNFSFSNYFWPGSGQHSAGGGGGAGGAGGRWDDMQGGMSTNSLTDTTFDERYGRKGGDGVAIGITGRTTYYGGGGGGGSHTSGSTWTVSSALGGNGGGGRGGSYDYQFNPSGKGEPGTNNTGGGGGGGWYTGGGTAEGGNGGPGIVVVRY
jgi:hypothetical protein